MKRIKPFLLVILLIVIDQLTKLWALTVLKTDGPIDVIQGVFQFRYLENRGAAFGMFQNQLLFFLILTPIILAGVIYCYVKMPGEKKYTPAKLICLCISAGAIGNLIDRIIHNFVVDFLYFELIDFPIFNVADIYVSVSAFVLLALFIFYYKEDDFDFLFPKKKTNA